ncbi:hypothetical protein FEM48_Zijuj01G0178200 [Ziziphus jujuba var. spinosa]|uniref:non-specific serine/threonine protein kinase n=1 Tax=Ziziphus jujuba var. spinosa TaxID=714518 RepID=A0A978W2P4_ZIZJJ|nr:hypothetical protein FEM48_Zijuj01G0178200 [Ziziphus jujuba var. spinosa]
MWYVNHILNHCQCALMKELGELHRIKSFSVADNLLSGPVPVFINANFTNESYANNQHLCGGPLDPCSKDRNPFIFGFGFGYAVSVVAVIEYYCCCSEFMCWSLVQIKELVTRTLMLLLSMLGTKNKRNEADDHQSHLPTMEHNEEVPGLEKLVAKISLTELIKATGNFSVDNIVGKGKIGTMYRAPFPNNQFLAVKRIHESQQFESQFIAELLALSILKHDNLIPLLGYCIEKNEKLLVYKYMSNGNLDDWLHPVHGDNKILEWPLRVKIAIGIARAWHGSIMSATFCSTDSGLYENGGVWESDFVKKDVYDYGRVALELITGKKTISGSSTRFDGEILELLRITTDCVRPFPYQRSTMVQVCQRISSFGEKYGIQSDSTLILWQPRSS